MKRVRRRRIVVDDTPLALRIGQRIKVARLAAGMTQQQLAEGRYTKAYISALEKGHAKPSMAALNFLSERLGLAPAHFLGGQDARWTRIEADLLLASARWDEAHRAYQDLLAGAPDRTARAELLRADAEALCRLNRGRDALRAASESVDLFRGLRRERDAALSSYWLAFAHYLTENGAEAGNVLRDILEQLRAGVQIEPDLQLRVLTALAGVERWEGSNESALRILEEARAVSDNLDDRRRPAFLSSLALALRDGGDMEGAIRAGTESLALYRAAQAQRDVVQLSNQLSNAYVAAGNLQRATELAAEARQGLTRLGDAHELAFVIDTEARILLARGEAEEAVRIARRAVAAARAVDNGAALADALVTLAQAAASMGDLQLSTDSYEQAVHLLRERGPRPRLQQVLGEWAEQLARAGEHERAYELTREALRGGNATAPA